MEEYKVGQTIKEGSKKYMILKINKKQIKVREFKSKTKGSIISLTFGDYYFIDNPNYSKQLTKHKQE